MEPRLQTTLGVPVSPFRLAMSIFACKSPVNVALFMTRFANIGGEAMRRGLASAGALAMLSLASAPAFARELRALNYTLPADKPVTVLLMRPDVEAGSIAMGGANELNADWTLAVRSNLQTALADSLKVRKIEFKMLPTISQNDAQMVADYEALHWTVANAMLQWMYGPDLPSKKYQDGKRLPSNQVAANWTLGPDISKIATLSGANYAVFLFTRDYFASAKRTALQIAGIAGCFVGFCLPQGGGGRHIAIVSLVDLASGDVVWIRTMGGRGDVREAAGARIMIDALIAKMPSRPGEKGAL
jgi:hypothetical protein